MLMNLKSMLYWLVVALGISWKVLMLSLKETPFHPFSEVWEIVLILGDWLIWWRRCRISCHLGAVFHHVLREANVSADMLA